MKKSLLALAVLGAFAGVASAQSSVTLSGTVDLNGTYIKNDGTSRRLSMGQDGINSSQLVFSGREDLGSGLWAGFNLNAGLNPEQGSTNSKMFNRRSTVSLGGNFGEIRIGRDYTPTFWNDTIYDPFGANGIAQSLAVKQFTAAETYIRADNSITYWLPPNLGGFNGEIMVAAGAGQAQGVSNPGRYIGGRFGYAVGPIDVALAYAQQRYANGAPNHKTFNVGGTYDFGVAKLFANYDRDNGYVGSSSEISNFFGGGTAWTGKENRFEIGTVVPIGQGEIHASWNHSKANIDQLGISNTVNMEAIGYVYNLSKRTALYTNVARLSNGDNSNNTLAGPIAGFAGGTINALPVPGGKSVGASFGIRHFF